MRRSAVTACSTTTEYELLFGVSDPNEPALELVKRLQQEFPNRQIRAIQCPKSLGLNGKVSTLAQVLPQAKYEHILINDSDIVAPPDYLRRVMYGFADERVGMVTIALSRTGREDDSLEDGSAGAEYRLHGRRAGGARDGGRRAVRAGCDDSNHQERAARDRRTGSAGRLLSATTTNWEHVPPRRDTRSNWLMSSSRPRCPTTRLVSSGLTRCAGPATCRDRRHAQYFGLIVTFGLAWGILAVLAAPGKWWTWAALVVVAVCRFTAAMAIGRGVLEDPCMLRDLWLLPSRDFVALAVWVASFAGNED